MLVQLVHSGTQLATRCHGRVGEENNEKYFL